MLDVSHLTKCYGEKKAVDDLSLHIAPGEIYGFIGRSASAAFRCGTIRWPASGRSPTFRITPIFTNI